VRRAATNCVSLLLFGPPSKNYLWLPTELLQIGQNKFDFVPEYGVQLIQ